MKKLLVGSLLVLGSLVVLVVAVQAVSKDDIIFPVAELGNCRSETDCRAYCDQPENIKACVAFAQKHNLISSSEAERAERFADIALQGGPGGCRSQAECEAYCENPNNIESCLAFAEERGLMPPQELAEAKKVAAALRAGATLPGNCESKERCEAYCRESAHMDECLTFAEKAGFISAEEVAKARKILPLMQRGETPGGCQSKEECESYCSSSAHFDECLSFAEKVGFISSEEAERARKTGGVGPGGCQSREECESFCNIPENQETCFRFAEEHGLIEEEKIQEMKEGMMRLREGLSMAPPEVLSCLKLTLGPEILEQIRAGTLTPGPQIGDEVRACFEKFTSTGEFKGESSVYPGDGPPPGSSGPGGCTSFEECKAYCQAHPEECGVTVPPSRDYEEQPELYREKFDEYREQYQNLMHPDGTMPESEPMMDQPEQYEEAPQTRGGSLLANILNLLKGLIPR